MMKVVMLMIKKLAGDIASICAHRGVFQSGRIEEYAYGYELLISTVINLAIILIIGAAFGAITEAIIFISAFALLRTIAGGYHAKSHVVCILIFSLVFLFFAFIVRNVLSGFLLPYVTLIVLVSSVIIYSKAPVAAPNKPFSTKKKTRFKKLCGIISCINLFLCISFIMVPALQTSILASYFSGVFAASLSLVAAGLINNNHKEANTNVQ